MPYLLDEAKVPSDSRTSEGATPLGRAAYTGKVEIVTLLLEHRASVDAMTKAPGVPLRAAADQGHADVGKRLLEKGAYRAIDDAHDKTSEARAKRKGHAEVAEILGAAKRAG